LVSELDFPQLVENLTVAGKEIGEDVIHEDTFLLVAMNMGRDDQVLVGGTLDALRKIEFPEGPFTVIITAALHFSEIEALTSVLGLSETEIGDNTKKIKSIPERMLSVYVPKTRKALINAQRLLGSNSRYAALLQNVECYADDAERFLREGRRELAVLSIGYAEGLLDSLRFLGELEITW
jgi:diphthine synthase